MRAYETKGQAELGLSDQEWETLSTFLSRINEPLNAQLKKYDIEEEPPTITSNNRFEPSGWVGTYPGGVTVTPRWEKITPPEYERMMEDIRGWTEILGAPTITSVLPFSPDVLMDARSLAESYSRHLIEHTEILLAHRPPVKTELIQDKGAVATGRPLFVETMREQGRGSQRVVSQRVNFSFETLPNLLLTRFHADLAGRLRGLTEENDYFKHELERKLAYHIDFVETGIPGDLLEESLEIDFLAPEVLARTRRLSPPEMEELVDLWEAYQEQLSLHFDLHDRLETAVKPMSKVYELWCLTVLIDILEDLTEVAPTPPDEFPFTFAFGPHVSLHYNQSLPTHSRYFRELNVHSGKPDYALEVDGEVVWIGDAKYRHLSKVGQDDYQRFLSYLVDYVKPGETAHATILFGGAGPEHQAHATSEYEISRIKLRPRSVEIAVEELSSLFDRYLLAPRAVA